MDCSDPPPLTDDQLSAALDAVEDDAVRRHLAGCKYCATRLAEARQIEARLAGTLRRWDCPPADALRDYHFGLLPAAQVSPIVAHLEHCPACTAELNELVAFLAPETAAPPIAEPPLARAWGRLRELVATLAPRYPTPALRGTSSQPLVATVEDVAILLDFTPETAGALTLIGQFIDSVEPERWAGALAEVRQGGALVATAALDEDGGFSCTGLAPGPAELRVTNAEGVSVVLPQFNVAG
jgi:anti-sigma factor RsiW